jgi:hypothetical protein
VDSVLGHSLLWIGVFNVIAGYVSAIALGSVASARRGRLGLAAHALLMPIYWLAISFAAYRALGQLVSAPYYWEKTEHFAHLASSRSSPTRRRTQGRRLIVTKPEGITAMPARSKAQQQAAGIALSAKRGEVALSSLKGASKSMYESMSEKQLEEFAATPRKSLPLKKSTAKG